MQGPGWLSLLRRLPPALHDGITIVTSNASEIIIQSVVRAERDLLIVRGRMSGSQDTGRVIFIPFDQINYVALGKKPTDPELQEILTKPVAGGHAAADGSASADVEEVEAFVPEAAIEPEPKAESESNDSDGSAPAATPGPQKPVHPSKTILLARLRARLAANPPPKPDDK